MVDLGQLQKQYDNAVKDHKKKKARADSLRRQYESASNIMWNAYAVENSMREQLRNASFDITNV